MPELTENRAENQRDVISSLIPRSCFRGDTRTSSGDHEEETNRQSCSQAKCKARLQHLLLFIGFTCIIICFVLASLGYMKLKAQCPSGKCDQQYDMFSKAQNLRLTAALLFILGICFIVAFIWMIKREQRTAAFVVQDVLVSNVTAEGLQKSPAPNLFHSYSHVHHLVYETPTYKKAVSNDHLPNYQSAVDLINAEQSIANSSVTPPRQIVNLKGVQMISVSIQVDEDDIDPPPSYQKAMELKNKNREVTGTDERDQQ